MNKYVFMMLGFLSLVVVVGCQPKEKQDDLSAIPMQTMDLNAVVDKGMGSLEEGATDLAATAQDQLNQAATQASATLQAAAGNVSTGISDMQGTVEQSASSLQVPGVREIQQALQGAGLYQGKIDGSLGPRTQQAIKDFQYKNGLKVDGKVGSKTWAKLSTYLANNIGAIQPTADAQETITSPAQANSSEGMAY
jgi:peptidoglycan hydrolase-like protein with peptidoglycan-binding domain